MKQSVFEAIKDGLSVFALMIIVAVSINHLNLHSGNNKMWNYLGKLEIVNFFADTALNGLIVSVFLIVFYCFYFGFIFSWKKMKNRVLLQSWLWQQNLKYNLIPKLKPILLKINLPRMERKRFHWNKEYFRLIIYISIESKSGLK